MTVQAGRPHWSLYRVMLDGTGLRLLTRTARITGDPAWSADGSRIAFAAGPDVHGTEIWVMRADGRSLRRLTRNGVADEHPAFSPDGTRIAYSHGRVGLWVMDAAGRHQRQVAPGEVLARPSWSPDGRRVVVETSGGRYGSPRIAIVPAAGGAAATLVGLPPQASDPAWSHDGKRLAFTARDGSGHMEVYVANADGSAPTQLTRADADAAQPAWSPDDRLIVYAAVRGSRSSLALVSAAGGGEHVILTRAGIAFDAPAW